MRSRDQKVIEPTPPMPRGATEFEEARIKRDFIAVFKRISDTEWHDLQSPVEYAYRCGRVARTAKDEIGIEGRTLPTYMTIE